MAAVDVLNQQGEKVGEIQLDDRVFAAPVREHLLWEVVTAQRAGWRAGSASTKGRSEVRGSTRKLFKQKGTGRARHGSIRSPIFVGGGTVFGPKPRDYSKRPPKKVRRGAMTSALSLRAREAGEADASGGRRGLVVLDNLKLGEIKTKKVEGILGTLGIHSGLLIDAKNNVELIKSTRNLAKTKYLAPEGLNVYDVLRYPTLVVTAEVVKQIEERLTR